MVQIYSLNQANELVLNLGERYKSNFCDAMQEFSRGGKKYMLMAQVSGKFVVVGDQIDRTLLEKEATPKFIMNLS